MFKQAIVETPLTTRIANDFFPNVHGGAYREDVSFVSTLRALVAPRIKEDEQLRVAFRVTDYTVDTINRNPVTDIVNSIGIPNRFCDGDIVIHDFYNTHENNHACLELMRSNFAKINQGWHILEKVTDFYRKAFEVLCFINPKKKAVLICVDNLDTRKLHYLQCSIFAFLPWYFNPKEGVSPIEMELIESLKSKDPAAYIDCIARIAEQYDFKTAKIRRLLEGFETKCERLQCNNIASTIRSYIDRINRLNREIGELLGNKRDCEIKLLGLETKIANDSGESEIMDYFLRNNSLVLESADDDTITFVVKTDLEYFDDELAKMVIENSTSYVYRPNGGGCNNIIPEEDMRSLMTAVFIDQSLKIKLCAAYSFNIRGNVDCHCIYHFNSECRNYMPNPHINRYRCLGNYQRAINELLEQHDYIEAIEQCVASCKSLNFSDSTVMCEFMRQLYGISEYQDSINTKCIELPDGSVVTPINAIKWLKSQQS